MATFNLGSTATFTSNEIDHYLVKELLENGGYTSCLESSMKKVTMPMNAGSTALFHRFVIPAVDTNPAPEGSSKASRALVQQPYQVQIRRYSESFRHSREAGDLTPRNLIEAAKDTLKPLIMRTREQVRWNAGLLATNRLYDLSTHSARNTVSSPISAGRLRKAVRFLRNQRGLTFTEIQVGTDKVGTYPCEASYFGYFHPSQESDYRQLPGWQVTARTPNGKGMPYEVGRWENIIFFTSPDFVPYADAGAATSTMISTTGTSADVFPTLICAKNWAHQLDLRGGGVGGYGNLKFNTLNEADKTDPDNSYAIVQSGWWDAALITNNDWVVEIDCAATANPA